MTEVLVIALLGATTYTTRAGGFWLASRIRPHPFFERWLGFVPGAVFVSLVAPMVIEAGPAGWGGALAAFIAMQRIGSFFAAILIAMLAYLLLRAVIPGAEAI